MSRVELVSGTPAELARPPGDAVRGVVLCPDIAGLRPLFDDLGAQLAADEAWAVCAVEPYPDDSSTVEQRLASGRDDRRTLDDLVAAADLLGTERTAVLGFCLGGMYALKAAGTGRFDRAVAFYGMIRTPEVWQGPGNVEPLEELVRPGACPALAIVGGKDRWTPPDDVVALERVAGVTVALYPEAEHGFVHDASRPAHRADDAADAWRRVREFLA